MHTFRKGFASFVYVLAERLRSKCKGLRLHYITWTGDAVGMQRRRKKRGKKEKGNEREGFFLFFLTRSLDNLERESSFRRRRRTRTAGAQAGLRVGMRKRCERRRKIQRKQLKTKKCKHGGQNADKGHKPLHLPVLNSPLALSLCGHFSGILGLQLVTKQPESCWNCVIETERRKAWEKKTKNVAILIAVISQDVYVWQSFTFCMS